MPRKPTGNPTGRPKGKGPLGQGIQRLTIRLPADLYTRLEAFADGRTFNRGTPDLAKSARQLLEHALDSLHKRQSISIPLSPVNTFKQPIIDTPDHKNTLQQTQSIPMDDHLYDPEPADRDSVAWRQWCITEVLRKAPEPLQPKVIAKEIGWNPTTVRSDLQALLKAGRVHQEANGYVYGAQS